MDLAPVSFFIFPIEFRQDNAETFEVDLDEIISSDTKADLDALVKSTVRKT